MGDRLGQVVARDPHVRSLVGLFLLGLALRLIGLLFSGMNDLFQIVLDWGFSVARDGLVAAFGINYGILSYAAFGVAAKAGEAIPRFWWVPYKLIVLAFEIAVLVVLVRLVPAERRTLALSLYWLNPWFVLHGAYHGFWEAPHVLFGLLAVLAVGTAGRSERRWAIAGGVLMVSAMFKPQGVVYFIGPLGLYLGVRALGGLIGPLAWYGAGLCAVALGTSALIWAAGGSALALIENYRSAFTIMSGISNGGPGFWRFVAFVYMIVAGQTGHVAFVRMPRATIALLSAIAATACLVVLVAFAFKVRFKGERDPIEWTERLARRAGLLPVAYWRPEVVLLVLTVGSLAISQFGVRAHMNHAYTAMVLMVPLAAASLEIRRLWLAMTALLGVSHLLIFGLGNATLLPPADILPRYPAAAAFVERVTALPAYATPDRLLTLQDRVSGAVQNLPGETIVSLLSVVVFVLACLMVRSLFRVPEGFALPRGGSTTSPVT